MFESRKKKEQDPRDHQKDQYPNTGTDRMDEALRHFKKVEKK